MKKIINKVSSFPNGKSINVLYNKGVHFNLFHCLKTEHGENMFVLFESRGDKASFFSKRYISRLIKEAIPSSDTDSSYFFWSQEARQFDPENCAIFTLKDLKAIQENPELIQEIIDRCGDKNTIDNGINYFHTPAIFMKYAQSMTLINNANQTDSVKTKEHMTILDYVSKERNKYCVKTPAYKTQEGKEHEMVNNVIAYFKAKYIEKILDMVSTMTVENLSDIINTHAYNLNEYLYDNSLMGVQDDITID